MGACGAERAVPWPRPVYPRRGRALMKKPCAKAVCGGRDPQQKTFSAAREDYYW